MNPAMWFGVIGLPTSATVSMAAPDERTTTYEVLFVHFGEEPPPPN